MASTGRRCCSRSITIRILCISLALFIGVSLTKEAKEAASKGSTESYVPDELLRDWILETKQSLERNLKGRCDVEVFDFRQAKASLPPHPTDESKKNTVHVYRVYPTKNEVRALQQLPVTYTQSDSQLLTFAAKRGYNEKDWVPKAFTRWEISTDHPGQNHSQCLLNMQQASLGKPVAFYERFKQRIDRISYFLTMRNAYIMPPGFIATDCGYFMGYEGCETRFDRASGWYGNCKTKLQEVNKDWKDFWLAKEQVQDLQSKEWRNILTKCGNETNDATPWTTNVFMPTYHKKVFVITALWDFNYHHFMADSLARFAKYFSFLKHNPDVKIHIRAFDEYELYRKDDWLFKNHSHSMRMHAFRLLNISADRLVSGPVFADEVIVPRALRCAWALSNPVEIRGLAKIMLSAAKKQLAQQTSLRERVVGLAELDSATGLPRQPLLGILARRQGDDRFWSSEEVAQVDAAMARVFPQHRIVHIYAEKTVEPDYCLACDVLQYSLLDVMVGEHGAGMTNTMFMKPGGMVVELAGVVKDVNMPMCGYYGPFGSIAGLHHYLHAYDREGRQPMEVDRLERGLQSFVDALRRKKEGLDKEVVLVDQGRVVSGSLPL